MSQKTDLLHIYSFSVSQVGEMVASTTPTEFYFTVENNIAKKSKKWRKGGAVGSIIGGVVEVVLGNASKIFYH